MGEWTPLYISLIILFVIGLVIPALMSHFVTEGSYNYDSFVAPLIEVMEDGFDITLFWIYDTNINPFLWFGVSFRDFLVDQMSAFSYIPSYFSLPLIFIVIAGIIYSIVKLLPTT